mgnify:CR=1 FL=1
MLFDMGTLLTMQSELNTNLYEKAYSYYQQSSHSSIHAAKTFQQLMTMKKRRRGNTANGKAPCPNTVQYGKPTKIVQPINKDNENSTENELSNMYNAIYDHDSIESNMYLNTIHDAEISGKDGVITKKDKCTLHIYKTSEWPVVPVHGNLWYVNNI